MALDNVLLIWNGKGGVGKSSLTANFCGLLASSGWNVLDVDLDKQGHQAIDLGVIKQSDRGENLLAAIRGEAPLAPIRAVRKHDNDGTLDLVPGGKHLRQLPQIIRDAVSEQGIHGHAVLEDLFEAVASEYDLVVVDMPPGDIEIERAAAYMGRWALIPTLPDLGSVQGLVNVWDSVEDILEVNQRLYVLGVALMLVNPTAKTVPRELRQQLGRLLGDHVPVFESTVRLTQVAALDCRARGLLAHEYEIAATEAMPWYEARKTGKPTKRFSSAAAALAQDYQQLTDEILELIIKDLTSDKEEAND